VILFFSSVNLLLSKKFLIIPSQICK